MNLQLPPRNILTDAELPPLPPKVDALPDIPAERLRTRGCEAWEIACRLIAATDLILEYNAELWRVFGNDLGEHSRAVCGNDVDQRGPDPRILMRSIDHAETCIQLLASMKVNAEPWNQMTAEAIRQLLPKPLANAILPLKPWLADREDRCLTLRGHAVNLQKLLKEGPLAVLKAGLDMVETQPVYPVKQRVILDLLNGRVLVGKELQSGVGKALHISTPTWSKFHQGQLKPLMKLGRIKNDRKMGGYFRPDAPPGST